MQCISCCQRQEDCPPAHNGPEDCVSMHHLTNQKDVQNPLRDRSSSSRFSQLSDRLSVASSRSSDLVSVHILESYSCLGWNHVYYLPRRQKSSVTMVEMLRLIAAFAPWFLQVYCPAPTSAVLCLIPASCKPII